MTELVYLNKFLLIMKGIIYFKKWTRMPWFSRLYHIKN